MSRSGKKAIGTRFVEADYNKIEQIAKDTNRSLSNLCETMILQWLKDYEAKSEASRVKLDQYVNTEYSDRLIN